MFDALFSETIQKAPEAAPGHLEQKTYYYQERRIICQSNHPVLFAMLGEVLGIFPEPAIVRGEATWTLLCSEGADLFPLQTPDHCKDTDTLFLPGGTEVKRYKSDEQMTDYLYFAANLPGNGRALSCTQKQRRRALSWIELPDSYDPTFLRRYIVLLTVGELLAGFGFEACHAAAITVPWDDQQGALILGASGSGKTTLSLGCVSQGYGLLGDDLVMLQQESPDQSVRACALLSEVSVRNGTLDLWPQLSFLRTYPPDSRDKRCCTIEEIRTGVTRLDTSVRVLLFPCLITGQDSTIVPLRKTETLQALIQDCMSKTNMPSTSRERHFMLLASLAEQAQGYKLEIARGDTAMPQRLLTLFAEATA